MKNLALITILFMVNNLSCQEIDYKKFLGKSSKVSIFKEYDYANLYDYSANSKNLDSIITKTTRGNTPEDLLNFKFNKQFEKNKDSIVFKLHLLTRLKINIDNTDLSIISYKTSQNPKISIANFKYVDKNWEELNTINEQINYLDNILKYANVTMIFEFYNDEDNPNYPEINKLKPLVKNSESILDIRKLAEVIEKNKNSLAKYLE